MPSFVDGWDAPIKYKLYSCGEDYEGPLDLSAATCVSLQAFGSGDVPLVMGGIVAITAASCGELEYRPASSDLSQAHALYHVRFRIVDGLGKVSFVPQDEPETWTVRRI